MKKLVVMMAGFALCAWSAQPDIRNARVTTEAAQPNLQTRLTDIARAGAPAWVGYEVETGSRRKNSFNGCGDVRYLEGNEGDRTFSDQVTSAAILMRTDGRQITRIDVVSLDCHLDGGGLPVHWLTGVSGDESVKLLAGMLADGPVSKKLGDGALFAVAIHRTATATQALANLARGKGDEHMKEQAAFWLGVERGHDGFVALKELTSDPDAEFRKKLTFDFSQNSDPGSTDELIRMAKTDEAPEVRGQAIFWLAQKAGKRQAGMISDIAVSDPNTEVKKKAVFALTQLPDGESYQELVKVAETNRDPAVRKNAIFWLGQSKDPRALEYLERVVKR